MSAIVARPAAAAPSTLRGLLAAELPRLKARARHLTGSSADADDLVHDTVERALCFETTFEMGSNLRAWLQQVLHSVFITRYRRRQRERAALLLVARDECVPVRPQPLLVASELSRRTHAALDTLSPQFRDVVCLVDLGELSYKEAAAELQVPVGTVMSRLFRARRLLASRLCDSEQPALAKAA